MAIAATHILTNASVAGASSYVTASGSPTTGRLQLLTVGNQCAAATVNVPTVTGAGLTWVLVATQVSGDNVRRVSIFRAMGTASAGALTIDMAGQTQIRAGWSWSEFSGTDVSGTNGSGAIVQSATGKWDVGDGAKTGITVTLGAFGSPNNATYGGIRFGTLTGQVVTVGTGFTQLGSVLASVNYQSEYTLSNDTTVDWTYPSEATYTQAAACEIKALVPAPTPGRSGGLSNLADLSNLTLRVIPQQ